MTEWESYRLSDFLLFSPRTYWRLFELHNDSLWPLPLLTLAAGFLAGGLALLRPRAAAHAVPILLAILWAWIAWSFFWTRYATINWAAVYVAPLFALQAALLLVIGAASRWEFDARGPRRLADIALLALALLYPLLAPLGGRPWAQAEIFGIAPDPTAIGTLALLLLLRARWCAVLLPIPILWCVASGVTLLAMESAVAWLPPAAALAAAALAVVQPRNTARA
jgi:hypothetical protein